MSEKNEALIRSALKDGCRAHCDELIDELRRLSAFEEQRDALLEALKGMEARFGCESSRSETKPKTYGCRHMAQTCGNCEGLVTGWMAIQAARAAIKAVEGEKT